MQDEVKRPLGDELLFGLLENGGHVEVDAADGKLIFRNTATITPTRVEVIDDATRKPTLN